MTLITVVLRLFDLRFDLIDGECEYFPQSLALSFMYFGLDSITNIVFIFAFYIPLYRNRIKITEDMKNQESMEQIVQRQKSLMFQFRVCLGTVLSTALLSIPLAVARGPMASTLLHLDAAINSTCLLVSTWKVWESSKSLNAIEQRRTTA